MLIAPAVSGAPAPELDAEVAHLDRLLDQATEARDLDEVNRLETWLWLDGPGQPEGRVDGPARSLLLDMNRVLLANAVPEEAGASGVDAWSQLCDVRTPATVACGDLDVSFVVERSRELAERLPNGQHRLLPGMAHLPQLEDSVAVAGVILHALAG